MKKRTMAVLTGLALTLCAAPFPALAHPFMEMCRPNRPNTADKTCVVDGDTIWLEGENIRLEGFDTPEPQTNICGGDFERQLAAQAR